jgi:hypothetical protein
VRLEGAPYFKPASAKRASYQLYSALRPVDVTVDIPGRTDPGAAGLRAPHLELLHLPAKVFGWLNHRGIQRRAAHRAGVVLKQVLEDALHAVRVAAPRRPHGSLHCTAVYRATKESDWREKHRLQRVARHAVYDLFVWACVELLRFQNKG